MGGYPFTWEHGKDSDHWIEEKLDRVLVSNGWRYKFPYAQAYTLDITTSDHLPIFLEGDNEFGGSVEGLRVGFVLLGSRLGWDRNAIREAYRKFLQLLHDREVQWKQRAKVFWLREGDANTRFFHAMTIDRKRKNNVLRLQNSEGVWCLRGSGLEDLMVGYFQDIFTSRMGNMEPILEHVTACVTEEMNQKFVESYSIEEVKAALFSMKPDKAPGIDVFNPGFFQSHWEIIMSKMIANKLKVMLDIIVSPTQNAFIPGRSIQDNNIIAFEMMHYFNNKRRGKDCFAALKMDISKAYDRMEWRFVQAMLQSLSRLISAKVNQGLITGWSITRRAPIISHYFFADDSLVTFQASGREAHVKEIMDGYAEASEQLINYSKSSMCFSRNTPLDVRYNVCSILGVMEQKDLGAYLDLLTRIGINKREVFQFMKDRMRQKLNSWKRRSTYGSILVGERELSRTRYALDSEIESNPSYLWRSLWESKKLIASGSLKRVGHGKSISIWEDPWVPLNLNGVQSLFFKIGKRLEVVGSWLLMLRFASNGKKPLIESFTLNVDAALFLYQPLISEMISISINFVRKSANGVAHVLA
ncbi:uncharacterized protein LOC110608826 [Manihot esculenta]|uniref:uncharacterized protein LOC110608826 n=1 Tax=Manihot esculenta TaxID=3983 RepID=UPI000B5D568D|nr:uncharacterized protein LOC110608826 [Manihot esculenta]